MVQCGMVCVCVGGGGAGIRIVLGMDGRLWLCLWGAVGIPLGGISSSDSPSLPLCYLLVCLGILMVDRRRANKLRRSMSSPPYFPAHHPPVLHAYTVSRAGSFVQARVPWTRSAPLLFTCCEGTPSTLSLLEANAHAHTPQLHAPRPSIKHAPHHCTHPPIPAVTAAHGLFRMGCAGTQPTVVATRISFLFVACARNLVPPRPPHHPHPTTHEYLELREYSCVQWCMGTPLSAIAGWGNTFLLATVLRN